MRLTNWEHADLLDFLRERKLVWTSMREERLWLLTNSEGGGLCGLRLLADAEWTNLHADPIGWTEVQVEAYIQEVLSHWTTYGLRQRFEAIVGAELAIELARMVHSPKVEASIQELPPSYETREVEAPPAGEQVYTLLGGGCVVLQWDGATIRARLHMPVANGLGFTSQPLLGIVRPQYTSMKDAAAALFGTGEIAREYRTQQFLHRKGEPECL